MGKFTVKLDFSIGYFIFLLHFAGIRSLKSVHTLFDKHLDHMLVKFSTKSHNPNDTKILTKSGSPFLTKYRRHFGRRFCDCSNCLVVNYQLQDFQFSVFQI